MKLSPPTLTALLLTGALAAARPAEAGVTIVSQRAGGETTIYLDGDHARVDSAERSERGKVVIIDAASKKVVMINDQEKSYMELTEADRQKLRQQMDTVRDQMKGRLEGLPPDQRKKIEEMMAKRGGGGPESKAPDSKFEPLGAKKTINGFSCETYRRLEEGKVREEICVVPWSASLVQKSDFAAIQKFAEGIADDFGGARRARREPLQELDKYPGVPIVRVSIDEGGKRGEEEQIKSIKRGAIPASKFAVPSDYKKRDMPFGRPPRR